MKVSAVVVSHGHARELDESLPALAPQVDELVVIANVPGSVGDVPEGTRVLVSPPPRSFAANVNAGVAATSGEYVVVSNPDAVPEKGAVGALVRFADEHPRAGLVGPLVLWPDGTWQPSLRRFPDVAGTLWRRTPLRLLRSPYEHQASHYGTRPAEPTQGDWLLGGACVLMRRSMLEELGGWDGGYRHYVEDIDLAYRAAQAGWERWLVPEAVVRHAYAAVIDKRFLSRHTLWHLRGMARFVRKHPEFLRKREESAEADSPRAKIPEGGRFAAADRGAQASRASRRRAGRTRRSCGRSLARSNGVELSRDEGLVNRDLYPPRLVGDAEEHRGRLAGADPRGSAGGHARDPGWSFSFTPTGPTRTVASAGMSLSLHQASRERRTLTKPGPSSSRRSGCTSPPSPSSRRGRPRLSFRSGAPAPRPAGRARRRRPSSPEAPRSGRR